MLFNSISFLIFFPIVTFIYFVIPYKIRYIWLLLASYFFYMSWNPLFIILVLIATWISYFAGIFIEKLQQKDMGGGLAKVIIIFTIVLIVSNLFFFKYFYFAVENINFLLNTFNISIIQPNFDIILPLGISFYTLQIIAYLIDVYKKTVPAEKNFIIYSLFIAFFPKMLAGPIERTTTFLPQLYKKHKFSYDNMKNGLLLMLYGFFLKMVIADRAAIIVNFVYDNYEAFSGLEIALAVTAATIQVYTDFAGYSAIAIGAAQVMGFTLIQNFNHPYFATSVGDYWRRWHRSLSYWLRDYIYFSLGGSRCSKLKKYRNLLITFTVSGAWHGANWTFITWGLMHGISIILADIFKPFFDKVKNLLSINTNCFSYRLFQIITTFLIVDFTRLFYMAPDMYTAIEITKSMFSVWNPWIFFDGSLYKMGLDNDDFWVLIFSIFILWSVSMMQERISIRHELAKQNLLFRWLIYIISIFYILIFGIYGPNYDVTQFIYFQF